jgi:translation initiation factor 5
LTLTCTIWSARSGNHFNNLHSNACRLRKAEKERIKAGEAIDAEEKARKKLSKSKSKKDKKSAEGDELESPSGPGPQAREVESDDDDVEWATDTSATAVKARMQEQLTDVTR